MESQLRQGEKLQSIGQLASGIAHEINTPTQYIGDNLTFLREAYESLQDLLKAYGDLAAAAENAGLLHEHLQQVRDAEKTADLDYLQQEMGPALTQSLQGLQTVTQIVRAMKEFAHPGTGHKSAVDINRAIESTLLVARNHYKYVAELEIDFDESLEPVPCLAGEINQVILNLLVNAADAIAEALKSDPEREGLIRIATQRKGDWVEIRVSDNGAGIPQSIVSRIFDPFFTTKEVGKGSGQGLAIARSVIVDKHGGTIQVQTQEKIGTTFIIRLPLQDQSPENGQEYPLP
jgi:signal transduction histidine kinase